MPFLPPRQEQAPSSGPSTGLTFGITFAGILGLGLVVLSIYFIRRRIQRKREGRRSPTSATLFDASAEEVKDRLMEQHSHSNDRAIPQSPPPPSSTPLLPTSSEAASSPRPTVPRLLIPASPPPPLIRGGFMGDRPASAVQSACMDSSTSAYSQFSSASTQAAILHAGPGAARHFPPPQQHPQGVATLSEMNAAVAHPLVTPARPRRSLHPFSGAQIVTAPDASRMHMTAIMELPSPFIFGAHPSTESDPSHRDTHPASVSPMSKLSNELDEFLDDSVLPTPTPDTAGHHWQAPETPPEAAYNPRHFDARVPPLQIRKNVV